MSYTLQTSGIATNLTICLAVDADGTTIKEFCSPDVNTNKTLDTGVAASVSTSTWKGVSRGTFTTTTNTDFNYNGVRFASGHRPVSDFGDTNAISVFCAVAQAPVAKGTFAALEIGGGSSSLFKRFSTSGALVITPGTHAGSTSLPSDSSTKYSFGFAYHSSAAYTFFYGLESGSLATDGSGTDAGFGGDGQSISGFGGQNSQGNFPGTWHLMAHFNRALTTLEMQSLHTDWFGTLFNTVFTRNTLTNQAVNNASTY